MPKLLDILSVPTPAARMAVPVSVAESPGINALQKRLKEAVERNTKLRKTVDTQQAELDELKDPQPARDKPFPTLQLYLSKESAQIADRVEQERTRLEQEVGVLTARLKELAEKKEKMQLENRRLAELVAADGDVVPSISLVPPAPMPQTGIAGLDPLLGANDSMRTPRPKSMLSMTSPGGGMAATFSTCAGSSKQSLHSGLHSQTIQKASTDQFRSTIHAAAAGVALWRAQDELLPIMQELLDGAERILRIGRHATAAAKDATNLTVMFYLADPWLRKQAAVANELAKAERLKKKTGLTLASSSSGHRGRLRVAMLNTDAESDTDREEASPTAKKTAGLRATVRSLPQELFAEGDFITDQKRKAQIDMSSGPVGPTTYYLAGKVTVHGYMILSGHSPQPPVFPDLAALPLRSFSAVVLPLQEGRGKQVLAALQVAVPVLKIEDDDDDEDDIAKRARRGGLRLTEAQLTGLQLICSMAVGILEMQRRIGSSASLRSRARDSLRFTSEVNAAHDIWDFEQRVKLLTVNFFNAATATLSWYNAETRQLLTTDTRPNPSRGASDTCPAEVGRRNINRVSAHDGLAGRCLRYMKVLNHTPTKAGHAPLLIGPLVAKLADGHSKVIGTLQLKKTVTGNDVYENAFTEEDEIFFSQLLNVISLAARRVMHAHMAKELNGSKEDFEVDLERFMKEY